jgi:hypothetical protein
MPTKNYSLMVMDSEHMVDGDVDDDDGGEDGVKIPLSSMESRTNLTPETKIVVVAALCFAKITFLLGGYVFRVYKGYMKGGGETTSEGQKGLGGQGPTFNSATCALLNVPLVVTFQSLIFLFR